jgi:hypothetical protein
MLIEVFTERVVHVSAGYPGGKSYSRKIARVTCDGCGIEFTRSACAAENSPRHFHDTECQAKSQRSGGLLAKVKERVFLERYGVTVPAKADVVKQRMMQTNLERRGVAWPTQDVTVMVKQAETNLERYGMNNVAQLPHSKQRANSPEACAKRHETMKRNGTYGKSSDEDRLYDMLTQQFGPSDVARQVTMPGTRWAVDFYIKSIDTYVQLDSVYWHGLDRLLEEVAEHKTDHDVNIHGHMVTDHAQDDWFKANGKHLVRITDEEFARLGTSVYTHLLRQAPTYGHDKVDIEQVATACSQGVQRSHA